MKIKITLNQQVKEFDVAPDEFLLDTLRNHHVTSVKKGCDQSTCGVCTVLVDGKPVLSCSLLSVRADGHEVVTVDGIQDEIEKISDSFGHEGADQCGYCNTGLALTIYAMKRELKSPSDLDIKKYVVGNLCRCSGYEAQFKAIKRYLGEKL